MFDEVLNMPLSRQSNFDNIFSLMSNFLFHIEISAKLKNAGRVEDIKNSKKIGWQSSKLIHLLK